MKKVMKCWEFFNCKEEECPVYEQKELRCWLVPGTHCRDEIQGKFIEKIEMCLQCEPFMANMDVASLEETLDLVNEQFTQFREMVEERDRELQGISMELALGLSEVFVALKQISSGDPLVRIPETSELELITKLKHLVNLTAQNLGEIVDLSHEFAMGLSEHFGVLDRVSKGSLTARILGDSHVELLESLKRVTNQMIGSVSTEITERKRAQEALRKSHEQLESQVEERTAELAKSNILLEQEISERKRAEERIRRRNVQLDAINRVLQETLAHKTHEEVAQTCLAVAEELTGSKFGFIGEVSEAGCIDTIALSDPSWEACRIPKTKAAVMLKDMEIRGIWGRVLKDKKPLIVNDPESHADHRGTPEGHAPINCFLGVPLKRAGAIVGLIGLANKESGYEAMDQRTIEALSFAFVEALYSKRAEEALVQAKEDWENTFDAITDMVTLLDKEHRIVRVNTATAKALGTTKESLVGKRCYEAIHERTRPVKRCPLRRTMETLKPHTEEITQPNIGGTFICSTYPIQDHQGTLVGYTHTLKDITESKRLESQLQHAQRMEAIGTLAGGIAHNFNNLLMGIQGYTSLMLLGTPSADANYRKLKNIEKLIQGGSKLTSQLIGYAREGRYEVRPVSLNQLVKETSDTFAMTKKQIRVHRELAEDLFGIRADQGQIEQVLWNLYVNAADAMPGGGDLSLRTRNITHESMGGKLYKPKRGDYVLLTMADTGVGMDKKTMERVFDPFFTTKEIGHGSGLGLASAYGIIKAHGGYIDLDSEKGKGTTLSIYLPASKQKIKRAVKPGERLIRGAGTVLLVDDEEVVLEVGRELLKAMGYEVLLARDGKEAIQVYRKNWDIIDIIVLDMVMPNMGGGEAYDRMKEINPDMKALLSSGFSINGEATEILERGCNGFIQKPFTMKELSGKIGEILEKSS